MELKKYKKRNKIRLYVLIILGFLLTLISSYLFYQSYALYEEAKAFDVINGSVEDSGDIYFAYYIDGEISREMPIQNTGYTLDNEKSNCTNNAMIIWDNASWEAKVNYTNYNANTNTRTKCTLYFNKSSKIISTVLGNIEINNYTPDFTKSACDDETCESHEKGIYETSDYDGNPTYYYRGSVENNYVKFAGYYWRIIRINSNGSIRMIYDGTSAHLNGEVSEDKILNKIFFNDVYNDNMSAGYMYEQNVALGLRSSSSAKLYLDNWYQTELLNYNNYFDLSSGYCGDRSTLNFQTGIATGTNSTFYKAYFRVEANLPTLSCENTLDYYTVNTSSIGNKALTYPIGLISVDEAFYSGYAGGIFDGLYSHNKTNINSFLTMGSDFWTMTPACGSYAYGTPYWGLSMFFIGATGMLDDNFANGTLGIRPVINIRSDVTITGSGTMTDPYVVN